MPALRTRGQSTRTASTTTAPDQTPKDYIVVVTLAITLRDMVKNRELWKDDALTRTAIYVPGAAQTEAGRGLWARGEARADAIRSLAGDIITRTLEPW